MPEAEFSIQLSLRTVFSVTVEEINVGALYLDLPAFNLTANTVTNMLSNCQSPSANTPPDDIYAELIDVNYALVADLSYKVFDGDFTGTIDTWTWKSWSSCYAFFPGLGFIGPPPASSKSALLTASPVVACTSSGLNGTTTTTGPAAIGTALKSLSPGAKAGAIVGE